MLRKSLLIGLVALFIPALSYGQDYGQNKIMPEKLSHYYETSHFQIYHSLDTNDPNQQKHLEGIVHQLESSREWLGAKLNHDLREKVPVMAYESHSSFEQTSIIDASVRQFTGSLKKFDCLRHNLHDAAGIYFLPEGVGAFAEPIRYRLVIKLDFEPSLQKTIIVHELTHIYQFDMISRNLIGRILGLSQLPSWFIEGGADFLADWYAPYTRDDIRRREQRIAGANPEKYLPTWDELNSGRVNSYIFGAMLLQFVKGKFGETAAMDVIISGLEGRRGRNMLKSLTGAINGDDNKQNQMADQGHDKDEKDEKLISTRKFDRLQREYWKVIYAKDLLGRPTPYDKTEHFESRVITPDNFPYPMTSPSLSSDGKRVTVFSIQENGVVPVIFSIDVNGSGESLLEDKKDLVKNLMPQFPPKPIEYNIAQDLNVWPFNGFDNDWSRAINRVAYFGRVGQDHALILVNPDEKDGDYEYEIIEIPLDQAFSPSISPDGKKIYFSASKNVTRNIYEMSLETRAVTNLTANGQFDAFDTAPVISPDGKKLAYIGRDGEFQHLFLLDLGTRQKRQLTFGRFNDNSPSWSEDGRVLVYVSDNEEQRIWNIYTFELETGMVRQYTNFFGGAYTPRFAPGHPENNLVYYTAYVPYDQYGPNIYSNFEIFELTLLKPMREYKSEDKDEPTDFAFRRENDLFRVSLDRYQLFSPKKPPKHYMFSATDLYIGNSVYYRGVFGGGMVSVSDILENQHYFIRFISYGELMKIIDGVYLNQENRWKWGYGAYFQKLPLRYAFYEVNLFKVKYPDQFILYQTETTQSGIDLFAQYPLDKFNRVETAFRLKNKSFRSQLGLTPEIMEEFADEFTPQDRALFNLFEKASQSSASFVGAYVRDTAIYNEHGLMNGNLVRIQGEAAPGVGNFAGYVNASIDVRKYFRLTSGSLFAARGYTFWSSNLESGDFAINRINEMRGFDYGRFVGNQFVYGSAELRLPFVDAIVFPGGFGAIGPVRLTLFGDIGMARFNDKQFPAQHGKSIGGVLRMGPFNYVIAFTDMDKFKDRKSYFFYGFEF